MINVGDMVVCSITSDFIIEDIRFSVPKGHAVTIPEEQVHRSIDLHRALSQGILFQLNTHSLMRLKFPRTPGGAAEEERFANDLAKQIVGKDAGLSDENDSLKQAKAALEEENARLRAEVAAVRAENARLNGEASVAKSTDGKLDQLLALMKDRPAVVQTVVQQGPFGGGKTAPIEAEDDAPKFIPSQIKPDIDASRIAVQEQTAESGGVSQAADALKRFRKQPSGQ